MPELPEVETTRRGIEPHLLSRRIVGLRVRERRLRWPVPDSLGQALQGQFIQAVERRGKYLLVRTGPGSLILHLGMSGSLRVVEAASPAARHDHLDLLLDNGVCLRLRDPRRFGAALWQPGEPEDHPLLRRLGPEPLGPEFDATYLHRTGSGRRVAIKNLIMDSKVVVGVGNIYANESLYLARIHPGRTSNRIRLERYRRLAACIREVLQAAISQGGTTLRDFVREDGSPGYFAMSLNVYGRAGHPCPACGAAIACKRIGQRSTFFCPRCQR